MEMKTIVIRDHNNDEYPERAIVCGRLAIHPTLFREYIGEIEWTISETTSGRALFHFGKRPHDCVFTVLSMLLPIMEDVPDMTVLQSADVKKSELPKWFTKWTKKHAKTFAACRDIIRGCSTID